jgi:hypothetical protein
MVCLVWGNLFDVFSGGYGVGVIQLSEFLKSLNLWIM